MKPLPLPSAFARACLVALGALAAGCAPDASASTAAPRSTAASPVAPARTDARLPAAAGAPAPTPSPTVAPGIQADEAMPDGGADELRARARHLVEALAQGNAQLASDLEFPRDGFVAARDAKDPTRAWERGVHAPFVRAIAHLRRRIRGLERAELVGFELGQSVVVMTPSKKEWRKPLWRVRHSRLVLRVDGRTYRVDVPEMTSWRGAWYVTKLR